MTNDRAALIHQAFRLEYLPLAWMTIEAAVAIGSGIASDSLTLTHLNDPVERLLKTTWMCKKAGVGVSHNSSFSRGLLSSKT